MPAFRKRNKGDQGPEEPTTGARQSSGGMQAAPPHQPTEQQISPTDWLAEPGRPTETSSAPQPPERSEPAAPVEPAAQPTGSAPQPQEESGRDAQAQVINPDDLPSGPPD